MAHLSPPWPTVSLSRLRQPRSFNSVRVPDKLLVVDVEGILIDVDSCRRNLTHGSIELSTEFFYRPSSLVSIRYHARTRASIYRYRNARFFRPAWLANSPPWTSSAFLSPVALLLVISSRLGARIKIRMCACLECTRADTIILRCLHGHGHDAGVQFK